MSLVVRGAEIHGVWPAVGGTLLLSRFTCAGSCASDDQPINSAVAEKMSALLTGHAGQGGHRACASEG